MPPLGMAMVQAGAATDPAGQFSRNASLNTEVFVISDVLRPALHALMQMPHIHVTRMRPRPERCSLDSQGFCFMQIMCLNAALQQETSCDEMVNAGLVVHGVVVEVKIQNQPDA